MAASTMSLPSCLLMSSAEPTLFGLDSQSAVADSQHLSKCASALDEAQECRDSRSSGTDDGSIGERPGPIQKSWLSQSGEPSSARGEVIEERESAAIRVGDSLRTLHTHSSTAFPLRIWGGRGDFSLAIHP